MDFAAKAMKPSEAVRALGVSPLKSEQAKGPASVEGLGFYRMYRSKPTLAPKVIGIDVFEQAVIKRMNLLSKLFELDGRVSGYEFSEKAKEIVDKPPFVFEMDKVDEDSLSHFALRLALCISEQWRHWFVRYELALFRVRMSQLKASQQQELLRANNIRVEEVSDAEYSQYKEQLTKVADQDHDPEAKSSAPDVKYYKVPFQRVIRLVERRRVLLRKGMAYVPQRHIMQLVEGLYRAHLMAEVTKASKTRGALLPMERDRILAFLDHVVENHNTSNNQPVESIDIGQKLDRRQVHDAAQVHFPMCMRILDERLHEDHHLKHSGRWQYGLFLKGLGLSLDEALEFWKTEMTKKVATDGWGKSRYAYAIRHFYGAEGKRTSYTSMGCNKIIAGPAPLPDMAHGCPFKHFGEAQLRKELSRHRPNPAVATSAAKKEADIFQSRIELPSTTIETIVKKAKDGFYTAACHTYFVATHPGTSEDSLFHNPVLYYAASRRYTEERTVEKQEPKPEKQEKPLVKPERKEDDNMEQ